ncbi:hypothetical protein LOTGIDRAFT_152644 [Lottia gigantea]|uniref:Uncharacterized protein n=1 Tax=Lottia gigantea TaxID=225164 RepID=V4C793_LOTGI|nr:hypothetical protein LOTGIDRAFT_152644 [Lottia gigantea]ESO97554.1 hypothetical protein LOTGIDRAFT_152644 [Lottia gigantea]
MVANSSRVLWHIQCLLSCGLWLILMYKCKFLNYADMIILCKVQLRENAIKTEIVALERYKWKLQLGIDIREMVKPHQLHAKSENGIQWLACFWSTDHVYPKMYDNNYISSSQDMHNYLDQLSGLQPVYRKNLSRSSECENQYTKPFRLSKISESTISKRGYERECYQQDKKVTEWKKPKLDDNSEKISKKCFPDIRDPRLKTSMVGVAVPSVNKTERSIYDTYRVRCKKKEPTAETGTKCDDKTDHIIGKDNPKIIKMSKGKEKNIDQDKKTALTETCKTENKYTSPNKAPLKLNNNSDPMDDSISPNVQDVLKKPVDNSNLRRKPQSRCIKIRVFPPLSKVDYENIWIKKAKVMLSEIPCSIRRKYKLKIVNKTTGDSKQTVAQCGQTDFDITKPSSEAADSLKIHCEHSKLKRDRESFLSSMEKELDDTKKLISSTNCDSIWVDPKVMSMSKTLQKACNTNSNGSTLAFKLKESPKSLEKSFLKKGHLFNLDKLRNSLQGTMNNSRNISKCGSKVSQTLLRDKSRNDERKPVNHQARSECKDDFHERRRTRATQKQCDRDHKTRRHHNKKNNFKSEQHHKHKQSEQKPIESSHNNKQSSLSIQYPQISSTNDPTTIIPDKDEVITITGIKDDIQKRKPTSRWDVAERSSRERKGPEGKNFSKSQKNYSSIDKVSRIVSDSRAKQNRSTPLKSSALAIQDQDLNTIPKTQEQTLNNVSELLSSTNVSFSGDKICMPNGAMDKDHCISTTNNIALEENVLDNAEVLSANVVPNALNENTSSKDSIAVNNNSDQNKSSSLELQTSVISVKSPISSEFLDPELNEFALESFVSEVEVETTVVEDTVLEHATVSCALLTRTPILNQIPEYEQSKTLVQEISVRKISLSEQILADTSLAYVQEKVLLQSNKEGCQTSAISDNPPFVDKDQQSVISNEISEHCPEIIESVVIQNLYNSTNMESNGEVMLRDCVVSVDTVSKISVEPCNITICESNVTDKLIHTDQNENSLKISEDSVGYGKTIESSQTLCSSSSEQEHGPEISKNNEIDQPSTSLMANSKQMEGLKEATNIHEPSDKGDSIKPSIQEEVVGNTNEINDNESSSDKERIEDIEKQGEEKQSQNTPSTFDSLEKNFSNHIAPSSNDGPQPVGNNSDQNTIFTLPKRLLYEDISNSSISEYVSKIEENELINNIPKKSMYSGDVAEECSSQNKKEELVEDEKSKQDTPASRGKENDPSITLQVSTFSSETSPSSTNKPDTEQSQPVAEVSLSEKISFSVAEDLASIPVEMEQPFNDPSLLSDNDASEQQFTPTNLPQKDGGSHTDSAEEILQTVPESTGQQFQEEKSVDVLQTVHEVTNDLPDSTSSICADMNDVYVEEKNSDVSNATQVQVESTALPDQTPDAVSSDNFTLIVDENSLEGCSQIVISKVDDASTSSSFSELPDSQNNLEYKLDDKKSIENNSKEMPYLEFVKNDDKKSKLKPNELDIANQRYLYEGCPLYYTKSLCINEGMKLPVRIASYDYDEEPKTQSQETVQKPRTESIGTDNDLSKPVPVPVDINSVTEHQQSDETILQDADNTEHSGPVSPVKNVLPVVSMANVCTSGVDHMTHPKSMVPETDLMARVEVSPSSSQSTKELGSYSEVGPSEPNDIKTISEFTAKPSQLQLLVRSPLCTVIPSLEQINTQRFVLRPCSTYLSLDANDKQTSRLPIAGPETVENEQVPVSNEAQFNQNCSLAMPSSHMISHTSSDDLPSKSNSDAQSFNIERTPFTVGSFSTQIDAGRHLAPTKTNKYIPQSITTNSIVRPILSIKQFDTKWTSLPQKPLDKGLFKISTNSLTEKLLTSDPSEFKTIIQLSQANQTDVFVSRLQVTVKDSEEQVVSSSEVNSTNVVTFPHTLPGDAVASLTPTNSSLGTILKISEPVKSSYDMSKLCDGVNEIRSNRYEEQTNELNITGPSDKIINSESFIEQKALPNIDILESEEVEHKLDVPNSDRSPKTELTRQPDHNNPHIHISIPLSRIVCSHISANNLVINSSTIASTSSVASSESSPFYFSSSSDLSPPKLSPVIELTNCVDENEEDEGEDTMSDCGSANTDETQVWKKGSPMEEIMSDETLIYSCDELEDIDQELKLNEKLKSEKQKILKVVQKLREELSENKMENNDILIRKRRRSQVLESLADTESGMQKSNQDSCSERDVKNDYKSTVSKQKQKFRKKRELNNEVLYDSGIYFNKGYTQAISRHLSLISRDMEDMDINIGINWFLANCVDLR